MKNRDIIVGLVVVVLLVAGSWYLLRSRNRKSIEVLAPTSTPSVTKRIQDSFGGITIPTDAEKIELNDVSASGGFGVATKTEILANLPEPTNGGIYKVWLENSQGKKIIIGNLRIAKGGYILEYNMDKYPGYNKVVISLGGKPVLEGSF